LISEEWSDHHETGPEFDGWLFEPTETVISNLTKKTGEPQ